MKANIIIKSATFIIAAGLMATSASANGGDSKVGGDLEMKSNVSGGVLNAAIGKNNSDE